MEESMNRTGSLAPKRGITGTGLKLLALISMFTDHIGAVLVKGIIDTSFGEAVAAGTQAHWRDDNMWLVILYYTLRLIGRFAFPLFAYLITEGFIHTHSVKNYALKLLIFALVSEIPFNLATNSTLLNPGYQNVFFTLLLGLLGIWSIRELAEKRRWSDRWVPVFYAGSAVFAVFFAYILFKKGMLSELEVVADASALIPILSVAGVGGLFISIVMGRVMEAQSRITLGFSMIITVFFSMVADFLETDYYAAGTLIICVMYLLRRYRAWTFAIGCVTLIICSNYMELTTLLMIIPVMMYNGKRGGGVNKYVFYIFYPLHFVVLYAITYLLGYTTFAVR